MLILKNEIRKVKQTAMEQMDRDLGRPERDKFIPSEVAGGGSRNLWGLRK